MHSSFFTNYSAEYNTVLTNLLQCVAARAHSCLLKIKLFYHTLLKVLWLAANQERLHKVLEEREI